MFFVWFAFGLLALCLMLLLIPCKFTIALEIRNRYNLGQLTAGLLYGLLPVKISLRLETNAGEPVRLQWKIWRTWKEFKKRKKENRKEKKKKFQVGPFLKIIHWKWSDLYLRFGIETDAAATAVLYGAACSSLNGILCLVKNKFPKMQARIRVKPDFGRSIFEMKFQCIVSVTLAHIIIIQIKNILKQKKEAS